jgi:hypothetical protein
MFWGAMACFPRVMNRYDEIKNAKKAFRMGATPFLVETSEMRGRVSCGFIVKLWRQGRVAGIVDASA